MSQKPAATRTDRVASEGPTEYRFIDTRTSNRPPRAHSDPAAPAPSAIPSAGGAPAEQHEPVEAEDPQIEVHPVHDDPPAANLARAEADRESEGRVIAVRWTSGKNRFRVDLPPSQVRTPALLFPPGSDQASSMRILCHRLKHASDPQVILITSARPGEGKTTCALNLACAWAEDSAGRVMLLEASCKSPRLAQILGSDKPACVLDQLDVRRTDPFAPWHVTASLASNLHLMMLDPEVLPTRTLNAALLGDLLLAAREDGYSHLVIDAPSVLGCADVNAWIEHADAVLFSARAGATRAQDLQMAAAQLEQRKLLGVVLLNG